MESLARQNDRLSELLRQSQEENKVPKKETNKNRKAKKKEENRREKKRKEKEKGEEERREEKRKKNGMIEDNARLRWNHREEKDERKIEKQVILIGVCGRSLFIATSKPEFSIDRFVCFAFVLTLFLYCEGLCGSDEFK